MLRAPGPMALMLGLGLSLTLGTGACQSTGGDTESNGQTDSSEAADDGSADEGTDADGGDAAESETGGDTSTDTGATETESGGDTGEESGGETGDIDPVFAQIQLELVNANGEFGNYPSCTDGPACHANPARNVVILSNPNEQELLANWQNIVEVPNGVTPWVTPQDETAQMLNEVSIPDDLKQRWLAWIMDGAPFE